MNAHPDLQSGHTLPELLIGLTLGLWVIVAATSAYGVSKQSWVAMAAADALHANAGVALRTLQNATHNAGAAYLEPAADNTVRLSAAEATGYPAIAGVNGSKTVERLTLGHWRSLDAWDCQGNASSTQTSIRNDYKLNTHQELTCKDLDLPDSTYQALAEGVEDFQVRYAQANPANLTLQWLAADQVTVMAQVVAIEVCIRLASTRIINSTQVTHAKQKGCADETLVADGRLRRVFKRVMTLRNRSAVMP